MITKIHSVSFSNGVANAVTIEVSVLPGIGIQIVGLADQYVREGLLRTIEALHNGGFRVPGNKIIINIVPSDCRLSNTSVYDLAIAVGIIAASGQRDLPKLDKFLVCGELGLDGSVRDIPNVADIADIAVWEGFKGCILPRKAAMYNSRNEAIDVFSVDKLSDAIDILSGQTDYSLNKK